MGMIIYVEGTLISDEEFTESQIEHIEKIKNSWGYPAFGIIDPTTIIFDNDSMEGCTPYEDGVDKPLKELLAYAKENGISLDGDIQVTSDWGDYDNISIEIRNNEPDYGNSEVRNATTDELVEELRKRGVLNDAIIGMLDYGQEDEKDEELDDPEL